MDDTLTIQVDPTKAKVRLDKLVAGSLGISRTKAQRIIFEGRVTIFGTVTRENSRPAQAGETYEVSVVSNQICNNELLPNPEVPLNILYEDADIIVIDKPPNTVVHPGHGITDGTIANGLLAHCGSNLSSVGSSVRPGIVHRLDKDTSGLMVVAKTTKAYYGLSTSLVEKEFRKEYLALVWGIPRVEHAFINTNIGVKRTNITMMEVTKFGGKAATTEYTLEKTFSNSISLVKCTLHTGRTHQIRVHMSHIGHSIVGDQKYGKNDKKCTTFGLQKIANFQRQALHASVLGFPHPSTKEYLTFTSSPSQDIQQLIETLEAFSAS